MTTFKVDNHGENKHVTLTTSIQIPYVGKEEKPDLLEFEKFAEEVIYYFSKVLIDSLQRRIEACSSNLNYHLKDIIFNDGSQIVYQRADKTKHVFNISTMQSMREAISVLQAGQYLKFGQNKLFVEQALKSIYWVTIPEDKYECPKKCDLISVLLRLHAQ